MRVLDRLARLDAVERGLLLEALCLLLRLRVALWLQPFDRVRRAFPGTPATAAVPGREPVPNPALVATAVRRASRLVPAATCLPRALATRTMLARRGVVSQLRIGVAKDDRSSLRAHAWIELEGRVLIGDLADLGQYAPLPGLPGDAA